MPGHAVVIAGGGPTGLMLAGELALAGIDVAIVERRASQEFVGSRGSGLHSRTIEVFDQRGIADRFLSKGRKFKVVYFHVPLAISDFPTRHNYVLGMWQNQVERILADWIDESGVPIYRGRAVTDFKQDDTGVNIELSDGNTLWAEYLVGCDGGRSLVRKAAAIGFPGWDPTKRWLIAEAETSEEPAWGFRKDALGVHAICKSENGQRMVVMLAQQHTEPASEPTLRDVSEAMIAVYETDYGIHNPTWISRFTDVTRQAATYRDKRVLLAGDAAHVQPPLGGRGLNTGVQDAVNLGWKLAQVVKRASPESLLNTYHAERHPVAARVLRCTMAQMALSRADDRTKALVEYVSDLLNIDEARRRLAAEISGLDIQYDFGEGHPLLGRRMPDLDLVTDRGPLRVFSLLHDARPVFINFGDHGSFDLTPWSGRVQAIDGTYVGSWELPVLGEVTAPTAVLIRPDGYVAWVGNQTQQGLAAALTAWFGARADGKLQ